MGKDAGTVGESIVRSAHHECRDDLTYFKLRMSALNIGSFF